MKNRKNYLKSRKTKFIWKQIGELLEEPCPKCGKMEQILIYRHDAVACISCNEWFSSTCNDPDCQFCSGRPDTPYEVYWNEKENPSNALSRKRWRQDNYMHKELGKERHEKRFKDINL